MTRSTVSPKISARQSSLLVSSEQLPSGKQSVYSNQRNVVAPSLDLPSPLILDKRMKMEGQKLLTLLPDACIPAVIFDPQYRGVLDKLSYGNEGKTRGKARAQLQQMAEPVIAEFISGISRILLPSGHLFLWMDKYHLCNGFANWLVAADLRVVDMITWDKQRMGMGYRTRRQAEYLVVAQKDPSRAKGVWKVHDIPDVWSEKVNRNGHTHTKPIGLQSALIRAVTNPGEIVVDPAAGSFSVLEACQRTGRHFLGCDING